MTHKAIRAVEHRRKVYKKYKDTSHPAYIQASMLANKLIADSKKSFECKLAANIKHDRNLFMHMQEVRVRAELRLGL